MATASRLPEVLALGIEVPVGWWRGWDRFHNRRQIASYTGLCPGIHRSNGRGREGSINRCGNSVVRYTLIEMAWRMLRWQPEYRPLQKLRAALRMSNFIDPFFRGLPRRI